MIHSQTDAILLIVNSSYVSLASATLKIVSSINRMTPVLEVSIVCNSDTVSEIVVTSFQKTVSLHWLLGQQVKGLSIKLCCCDRYAGQVLQDARCSQSHDAFGRVQHAVALAAAWLAVSNDAS
jgi:hypothetical protein